MRTMLGAFVCEMQMYNRKNQAIFGCEQEKLLTIFRRADIIISKKQNYSMVFAVRRLAAYTNKKPFPKWDWEGKR